MTPQRRLASSCGDGGLLWSVAVASVMCVCTPAFGSVTDDIGSILTAPTQNPHRDRLRLQLRPEEAGTTPCSMVSQELEGAIAPTTGLSVASPTQRVRHALEGFIRDSTQRDDLRAAAVVHLDDSPGDCDACVTRALTTMIRDESLPTVIREAALIALHPWHDSETVVFLVAVIMDESNPGLRAAALKELRYRPRVDIWRHKIPFLTYLQQLRDADGDERVSRLAALLLQLELPESADAVIQFPLRPSDRQSF